MAKVGQKNDRTAESTEAAAVPGSAAGPERLQTAIRITSPASWVIGAVFAFVTVAVIIWGVLGELSTRVNGLGLVFAEQGDIYDLRSVAAGTVTEVAVSVGDNVKNSQLIARIAHPNRDAEIRAAKQKVTQLQQVYDQRQKRIDAELVDRKAAMDKQIAGLRNQEATLGERLSYLTTLLATMEAELKQQLVTEARVEQVRTDIASARVQLYEAEVKITQASLQYLENVDQRHYELAQLRRDIEDAESRLDVLRQTQIDESIITAPEAGRIISVETKVGDVVAEGTPIVRIDREGGELRVLGFFDAAAGKKIGPGMDVSVSPSTAERAIWGTIRGKVKRVSVVPETLASVDNLLGNRELTEQIFASGPPIMVEVTLETNPSTPSGLDWSSGTGPPYRITHGTMSAVSVVIRKEVPANLVIPIFRSWIGHGS